MEPTITDPYSTYAARVMAFLLGLRSEVGEQIGTPCLWHVCGLLYSAHLFCFLAQDGKYVGEQIGTVSNVAGWNFDAFARLESI